MSRRGTAALLLILVATVTASPLSAQEESVAGRLLAAADRHVERGEYQEALDQLQQLLERFPGGEWAGDALLRTAELHVLLGQDDEAAAIADRLAGEFSGSAAGAGGEVIGAEIEVRRALGPDDLNSARERLRQIPVVYPADAFPDLPWRARALVRLGELYRRSGDDTEAARAYVRALEDEPLSAWTSRAAVGFAETLLRKGEWEGATELLQGVVENSSRYGGDLVEEETTTRARGILALVYRFHVAPAAGAPSWVRTTELQLPTINLQQPKGIAVSSDGRMLIVDERIPLVGMFDAAGNLQASLPLSGAELPFWGADGTAYFTNNRSILKIQTSQRVPFTAEGDEVKDIRAGYVDAAGRWFVVDTDDDRVTQYDPQGRFTTIALPSRDREPMDIVGRGTGELYVLDRDQKQVISRAPDTNTWTAVVRGSGWDRPTALALDLLGNLYVLDERTKQVHVYDATGAQRHSIGPALPGGGQLGDPRDLSVDAAGRIFIADREEGTIWILE